MKTRIRGLPDEHIVFTIVWKRRGRGEGWVVVRGWWGLKRFLTVDASFCSVVSLAHIFLARWA